MKPFLFACLLALVSWCGLGVAFAGEADVPPPPFAREQMVDPEMARLQAEANRLGQEFMDLFADAAGLSQQVLHTLAKDISSWITANYPKISPEKQERIRRFVERMKEKYATAEKNGIIVMREVLKDFLEILEQLEQGREDGPTPAPDATKEPPAEDQAPVRL